MGAKSKIRRTRSSGAKVHLAAPKDKAGLKLISIGTSTGAIIPKDMLMRLKVDKGDVLFAVDMPDGILLTPYDPEVEKQLSVAREFMREYRDTFRALAR
jgi:putative addiction module antidote